MKKKAIIHIGGHKTGSTAIQNSLFDSSSLLNKQSICYPLELTHKDALFWGQHSLAWYLMGVQVGQNFVLPQQQIDQSLHILRNLKNQYSNLILSSENFIQLEDNAISQLHTELSDFDLYVVLYVRRQDDATAALYQTDIVNYQEFRRFDNWLTKKIHLFDYFSVIKKWQTITNCKFIIRPYDRERLENGDVVADFNKIINTVFEKKLLLNTSTQNLYNNQSLPVSITSLIRYYNAAPTKQKIVPALRRLGYELNSLNIKKSNLKLLSPSMRQSILDKFHEGNLKLSKEHLGLHSVWFDESINEKDDEWKKNNAFNGSELLALVNEILNALTSLKEK